MEFILRRSNTERLSLKFPRHDEIMSLRLLLDRSRTLWELILQINEGIIPLKLFLEIERKEMLIRGNGSGPWSELE